MPDYGFIAQQQQPDSFKRIGEMINFASGAQNFQRQGLELEKARQTFGADVEAAKAHSSSAVTAADLARQTLQPRVEQQVAQTAAAKTGAQREQWTFDAAQAHKAYEIAAGVAQDPSVVKGDSQGSMAALMRAEDQARANKIPEEKIRAQFAPLYMIAANKPEMLRQALDQIVRSGAGVAKQAEIGNAPLTPIGTGGGVQLTQTQPGATGGAGPVGQPIPTTLGPDQRQQVGANPVTGNPQITEKSPSGVVEGIRPAPVTGAVPVLNPGDREAIPILTQQRTAVNQAAAKVPETRFNNSQIIKLADETNTGKGADIIRNLKGGYAGLPWTADTAKNFDTLGHFIALESVNHAKAMGAGTDAARTLAEQANTSTGWTRESIKTAAKVNDALATGVDYFNRGMEKAIQANGGNVLAVRDFQNAWSQNFDPNVYRYANALQSGDKAEITKILGAEGSPARAAKARELAGKSAILFRLSNEGR